MPKIIFNYKICDQAPECSGITTCPNGAITFDEIQKKPLWHADKCTFCLKCTLPDCCPVGAILYAADDLQEKSIVDAINNDSHDENWLWLERYGVFPSIRNPQAIILNQNNFSQIIFDNKDKIIDLWRSENATCRLRSPLFSDLVPVDVIVYKLDAQEFPELATKLNVTTFPSLLAFSQNHEVYRYEGYIEENQVLQINTKLKNIFSK